MTLYARQQDIHSEAPGCEVHCERIVMGVDYDTLAAELKIQDDANDILTRRMNELAADLADMTADYHRWHDAYMELAYPGGGQRVAVTPDQARIATLESAARNVIDEMDLVVLKRDLPTERLAAGTVIELDTTAGSRRGIARNIFVSIIRSHCWNHGAGRFWGFHFHRSIAFSLN